MDGVPEYLNDAMIMLGIAQDPAKDDFDGDAFMESFVSWVVVKTTEIIITRHIYVDIAGDLAAGILLSRIVFYHTPNENTGRDRLRVYKDNRWWIAKEREDWWGEIRLTAKQVDRALDILIEKGLAYKDYFRFSGLRTMHVRLDWKVFATLWRAKMSEKSPVLPKGEDRGSPKVNPGLPQRVRPLTESTTENTTGTTTTAALAACSSSISSEHNVNTHSHSIDGAQTQTFQARSAKNRKQPETIVKCALCLGAVSDYHHDACPGCGGQIVWVDSFQADQRQKAREKASRTQTTAQDGAWQGVQAVAMLFPAPRPLNALKFNLATKAVREQQDPDGTGLVELAKRLANHKKSDGLTAEGFLSWLSNTYNLYGPNAYLNVAEEAKKVSETVQHIPKDGELWAVPSIDGVPDWSRAEKL